MLMLAALVFEWQFILIFQVIVPSQGDPTPQLELYPISVKLLRHQTNQQRQNTWNGVNIGKCLCFIIFLF